MVTTATSHFDSNNIDIWANANVYIGGADAVDPGLGEDWGTGWHFVGALDGGQGFDGARDSDQKDHFGWGTGIVAQTDKHHKETKSFTALENNAVVRALKYPGTTFSATSTGTTAAIKVPTKQKFKIGFETINGTKVERLISANYAQLEGWAKDSKNEDDIATTDVTVVIYPNTENTLWNYQLFGAGGAALSSAGWIDLSAATPATTTP